MPIQQSNPFISSPSSNKNKKPDSDVWNFILFLSEVCCYYCNAKKERTRKNDDEATLFLTDTWMAFGGPASPLVDSFQCIRDTHNPDIFRDCKWCDEYTCGALQVFAVNVQTMIFSQKTLVKEERPSAMGEE